ncbi:MULTISPECIES: DeoR/GlpR family DNA-binding transcription regulator [Erwinia]|uniref:DeoR/GlpR family DNA-binding transcription regulator n=1 Tax=Erwinia TaxID=551 RepID=UPI00105C35C4|nr:DeoR/GlpR family DNA-binding transcription regulator [Erwinia aphidicola]MCP2231638.1 DeoR/GlpR family transcriptional regulator of sugar metabolism [Erwinia aphidicola]
MKERQRRILDRVEEKGKVSISELARLSGVSGVTIRKDLAELESLHYLSRAHGYAVSLNDLSERVSSNFTTKEAMAKRALTLLEEGDTLFIEAGSSNAHFAREIGRSGLDVMVVTPCVYVANELKNCHQDVVLIGGVLQKRSECLVGPLTHLCINNINFNKVFIGIDGYHPNYGFTGRDIMRAENIRLAIEKGVQNFVIAESAKFGKLFPYNVAKHSDIDTVITDAGLLLNVETALTQQGVTVMKA